jgi:hypothetical protein
MLITAPVVLLTGPLADQVAFGTRVAARGRGEMAHAATILDYHARINGRDPSEVIVMTRLVVLRVLRRSWPRVITLAHELDRCGQLSGAEAAKFFN